MELYKATYYLDYFEEFDYEEKYSDLGIDNETFTSLEDLWAFCDSYKIDPRFFDGDPAYIECEPLVVFTHYTKVTKEELKSVLLDT